MEVCWKKAVEGSTDNGDLEHGQGGGGNGQESCSDDSKSAIVRGW